jgi:hypothetical protein
MDFPCPIYQFHVRGQVPIRYPDHLGIQLVSIPPKDHGLNYAESIRVWWKHGAPSLGLVVLEHDVAVPLEAWQEMRDLIRDCPDSVVTVPFLLYPASTGGRVPHWSTQVRVREGELRSTPHTAAPPVPCDTFGLGCTYLPPRLLALMPEDLQHWGWPCTDWKLSQLSMDEGIHVRPTLTTAVHLHY